MRTIGYKIYIFWFVLLFLPLSVHSTPAAFRVIIFFSARHDLAHISFVKEAIPWFKKKGIKNKFHLDTTSNWTNMNAEFLKQYQVILFLDARIEQKDQRLAFENYIKAGGAWMGFHFSGFALTPSAYPQDWDWYHLDFLGSGEYGSNTWRPTRAYLTNEKNELPFTRRFPKIIHAAPNEWYKWQGELRKNPNIEILLSIHPKSFPLGTGPKLHEIWRDGDYPIAWRNKKYKMIYFNFGHNDMDFEGGSHKSLSSTFSNRIQNNYILKSLLWLSGT